MSQDKSSKEHASSSVYSTGAISHRISQISSSSPSEIPSLDCDEMPHYPPPPPAFANVIQKGAALNDVSLQRRHSVENVGEQYHDSLSENESEEINVVHHKAKLVRKASPMIQKLQKQLWSSHKEDQKLQHNADEDEEEEQDEHENGPGYAPQDALQQQNVYLQQCNNTLTEQLRALQQENEDLKSSIFIRYVESFRSRYKFRHYVDAYVGGAKFKYTKNGLKFTGALQRNVTKTDALLVFECIKMWFMSMTPNSEEQSYLKEEVIQNLVRIGLKGGDSICDEIFCQIIKQTRFNMDTEMVCNGYNLIAIICGILLPSRLFIHYFASFLVERSKDAVADSRLSKLPLYGLVRLNRLYLSGRSRDYVPIKEEIKCIMTKSDISVQIRFLDGSNLNVFVNPQCTSQQLVAKVCAMLGLKQNNWRHFALYECLESSVNEPKQSWMDGNAYISRLYDKKKIKRRNTMEEMQGTKLCHVIFDSFISKSKYIEDDESVVDVLGKWEAIKQQIVNDSKCKDELLRSAKLNEVRHYSLLLRFRSFTETNEASVETLREIYCALALRLWALECSYKLCLGHLPVAQQDAWELSSVLLQVIHGIHNEPNTYYTNGVIRHDLFRYLPCYMLQSGNEDRNAIEVKILTMHGQYEHMNTMEATDLYLNDFKLISSKSKLYGSSFFPILYFVSDSCLWEICLIGISQNALSIIRPVESFEIVELHHMNKVLSSNYNPYSLRFDIMVGGPNRNTYLTFFTKNHAPSIQQQILLHKK